MNLATSLLVVSCILFSLKNSTLRAQVQREQFKPWYRNLQGENETTTERNGNMITDGNHKSTQEPREESGTVSNLTEREKGIIIIAVILSVVILCLIVCALCMCCITKADENDDAELLVQQSLPEPTKPQAGWTSIRSETGNEPTTRNSSKSSLMVK